MSNQIGKYNIDIPTHILNFIDINKLKLDNKDNTNISSEIYNYIGEQLCLLNENKYSDNIKKSFKYSITLNNNRVAMNNLGCYYLNV